ncbi:MAG: hypothetical protein IPJ01_10370 [Micavibrio sp.]|nr:hypothetical protein [Micavibrio sp.]
MKTPEEIEKLAEKYLNDNYNGIGKETVLGGDVIDVYTKGYTQCQQDNSKIRIEFAMWLCGNYGKLDYEGNKLNDNQWSSGDGTIYTVEELEKEFIKSLNNKVNE